MKSENKTVDKYLVNNILEARIIDSKPVMAVHANGS